MCGFVGYVSSTPYSTRLFDDLMSMGQSILHRGPDSCGVWHSEDKVVGLLHQRLAVVDLSSSGAQPMQSGSRRYVMVFNGEIYNFKSIRSKLKQNLQGYSDTEVLLASFEEFGIDATLKLCKGMFSIALWDKVTKSLTLIRDRVGEKPLYYTNYKGSLIFGSDLNVFKKIKKVDEISRESLCEFIQTGYVSNDSTIFNDVYKVKPGAYITFCNNNAKETIYWSANESFKNGMTNPFVGSFESATIQLEELLLNSISDQMISDVPLGAFLSGGVDSSLVVALMQELSNKKINTFSIGFEQKKYNEAHHAAKVAKHIGTNHDELYVTPEMLMDFIPNLPTYFSEPFGDVSQLPTLALSKLTRGSMTVALSGDAGDELFYGYTRYERSCNAWNMVNKLPHSSKKVIQHLLNITPASYLNYLGQIFDRENRYLGDKVKKFSPLLDCVSFESFYRNFLLSSHRSVHELLSFDMKEKRASHHENPLGLDCRKYMMYSDFVHYLPNDILTKVDRSSMAFSLESRVPMLDHNIIEFAHSLPCDILRYDNQPKAPLRSILYKYVPKELIERPKKGFGAPIEVWLRSDLKEWAYSLLCPSSLKRSGFFNEIAIANLWAEHQSGVRNWSGVLWNIIVFQQWYFDYFEERSF